eukprot:7312334-Pyramimonas_sp.AAC.1
MLARSNTYEHLMAMTSDAKDRAKEKMKQEFARQAKLAKVSAAVGGCLELPPRPDVVLQQHPEVYRAACPEGAAPARCRLDTSVLDALVLSMKCRG